MKTNVYKSLFIYWQCAFFEPDDDNESFLSQFFLYICCSQHIRLFCFFSASMNCIRFRHATSDASRRTYPEVKSVWKANHLNIFFLQFLQFAISNGHRDHLTARNRVLYLFVPVSIVARSRNNFSFIHSELVLQKNSLENRLQIRNNIPSSCR